MVFAESSYLPRRAPTLYAVRMLYQTIAYHFLEWKSAPNLAPGCFVALRSRDGYNQKPFYSALPLGELDTISYTPPPPPPPLAYVQ